MAVHLFITGFLLCLSLCMDLGIVNVAMIRTGVERGFLPSFMMGLGSTLGDLIYAALTAFGIGYLIQIIWIRWIIWIGGTLVLLYFCAKIIFQLIKTNAPQAFGQENGAQLKGKRYFYDGMILALSSPTSILWYATAGGSIIASKSLEGPQDILIFLGGFECASVTWSLLIAWMSHKSRRFFNERTKKIFLIASAALFIFLALSVFINGYDSLILKSF